MKDPNELDAHRAYMAGQAAAITSVITTVLRNIYTSSEELEELLRVFEFRSRTEATSPAEFFSDQHMFNEGWCDFMEDLGNAVRSTYEESSDSLSDDVPESNEGRLS